MVLMYSFNISETQFLLPSGIHFQSLQTSYSRVYLHPKDSGNHLDYCSSDVTVDLSVWLTPDKLFSQQALIVMGLCERPRNFALDIDFYFKITANHLLTGAFFKLIFWTEQDWEKGRSFYLYTGFKNLEIFHDFHFWHKDLTLSLWYRSNLSISHFHFILDSVI